MTGVVEAEFYLWRYIDRSAVADRHKLVDRVDDILLFIQHLAVKLLAGFLSLLFEELDVPGLYLGAVHHDQGCQVPGGRGGIDITPVAAFGQEGQHAAVVKMGMGQYHGGYVFDIPGDRPVLLFRLLSVSLKGSAVYLDPCSVNFEVVPGTCNLPGRSSGVDSYAHTISFVVLYPGA